MAMAFAEIIEIIYGWLWGPPMMVLVMGAGVYLSVRLKWIQFRRLGMGFRLLFETEESANGKSPDGKSISPFSVLCTSLAATLGTGNIVGVATALFIGGPGALFWMMIAAALGMAVKYSECLLAAATRRQDADGRWHGGPFYYMERLGGLFRPMAKLFCVFTIGVSLFGIGTLVQSNTVIASFSELAGEPSVVATIIAAGVLAIICGIVIAGGLKRISGVATLLVPVLAMLYLALVMIVILSNLSALVPSLVLIVRSAFAPAAVGGGAAGAGLLIAMKAGLSRGVLSNEAGLGSEPIAAAASSAGPAKQGLVSMLSVFIDTIVLCFITGLALVMTGAWNSGENGIAMTNQLFEGLRVVPFHGQIVPLSLIFFGFATIISWCYYGEESVRYLLGRRWIGAYRAVYVAMVFAGAFLEVDVVFAMADIANVFMMVPNLFAVLISAGFVVKLTKRDWNPQSSAPLKKEPW